MGNPVLEILFILLLIIANGVFSMAEASVVAARKARLQQAAQEGNTRAAAALALAENPNRFLSTVQMGITLIGILSGAFGGATLSRSLEAWLQTIPTLQPYASSLALGIVVLLITYLSLIVGELVPKRLALNAPEKIAGLVAGPMSFLSLLGAPFVTLLTVSADAAVKLMGLKKSTEPPVTEEEIKVMMEQGTQAGVFHATEQDIVQRVFRLGDRRVSSLMTRRPDIVWINLEDPAEESRMRLAKNPYSRVPVCRGSLDRVVGVVRAKDLLDLKIEGQSLNFEEALQSPLYVPESVSIWRLLETMKSARTHMAVVIDEHGGTEGLVTLYDIMTAVVGDLPSMDESDQAEAIQREDGSWLVDGMIDLENLKQILSITELPGEAAGDFSTLSGLVLHLAGRVPTAAERFQCGTFSFEIMDMDSNRIDKVLVTQKLLETQQ